MDSLASIPKSAFLWIIIAIGTLIYYFKFFKQKNRNSQTTNNDNNLNNSNGLSKEELRDLFIKKYKNDNPSPTVQRTNQNTIEENNMIEKTNSVELIKLTQEELDHINISKIFKVETLANVNKKKKNSPNKKKKINIFSFLIIFSFSNYFYPEIQH